MLLKNQYKLYLAWGMTLFFYACQGKQSAQEILEINEEVAKQATAGFIKSLQEKDIENMQTYVTEEYVNKKVEEMKAYLDILIKVDKNITQEERDSYQELFQKDGVDFLIWILEDKSALALEMQQSISNEAISSLEPQDYMDFQAQSNTASMRVKTIDGATYLISWVKNPVTELWKISDFVSDDQNITPKVDDKGSKRSQKKS